MQVTTLQCQFRPIRHIPSEISVSSDLYTLNFIVVKMCLDFGKHLINTMVIIPGYSSGIHAQN